MKDEEEFKFGLSKNNFIVICLIIFSIIWWRYDRPVRQPDGVLVAENPIQNDYLQPKILYEKDGTKVSAVADYLIRARVLSKEHYRIDEGAWFAPWDFAIGWGAMSDNLLLNQLHINQGGRFYFYSYPGGTGLSNNQISPFSANMHLAPADASVSRALSKSRVGDIVVFKGKLVNVEKNNGWHWYSSLSRTDTGAGACELVWVEEVVIE